MRDALLLPLIAEAQCHPALWQKMSDALEALPKEATTATKEQVVIIALVSWMKDRRP